MSGKTQLVSGNNEAVQTRRGRLNGRPRGLVAYTHDLYEWPQRSLIVSNDDQGRNMAVDGRSGGTTEDVYDGGDTAAWTPTALVGTWDFTSATAPRTGSASVRAWNMNNGDTASIAKGSDLDMTNFAGISGWVRLDRFDEFTQQITLAFYDNSVIVGSSVNVIDYIDGGITGSYQRFIIPKEDFGVGDVNIDEIQFTVIRPSGQAPRFYLDDIEINETIGVKYTAQPNFDQVIEYNRVEFTIAAPLAGTVTNGTMPGLSYDQLMGLTRLENGIVLQRILNGLPRISVAVRDLRDFMSLTYDVVSVASDGVDTIIKLRGDLPVFSRLDGRQSDSFNVTINDDLSSFHWMSCILIGRELEEYEAEDDA